jgi:hypothetical protein
MPLKPVVLKLSESAIDNMLIVSPPAELRKDSSENRGMIMKSALDIDFLKENGLVNALDAQTKDLFTDSLSRNFLDNNFLANILDMIDAQMAAQMNLLNTTSNKLLPDYVALTGIIVAIDEPKLTLFRDDGSNVMSVTVPTNQNSTIYMTQGAMDIKNRVNSGAGTVITLIQK